MAPPTVQTLQRLAAETGYRLDTLEKVLRLLELLDEIAQDPVLSQRLALKGGTALNVFYLDLDRTLGGYRLELRRRAGPGGDGARTSGGRCCDRSPVGLAGLRCPPPRPRRAEPGSRCYAESDLRRPKTDDLHPLARGLRDRVLPRLRADLPAPAHPHRLRWRG